MMIVFIFSAIWISSLLVPGVLSADGDVGSSCATADACTDNDAFCDTSDASDKKCRCKSGFVQDGTACARGWGRPCDRGLCLDNSVCAADSRCSCDTENHFKANGTFACACGPTYMLSAGKCLKKVGQPCDSAADCLPTDGMVCADRGGTNKCTCDTTKNYAEGTDDATACSCATGHAKKSDKTCGLVIGKNCTNDASCIDNALCFDDGGTLKCQCDTTEHFGPAADNTDVCSCASSYAPKADKSCGLVIGENCTGGAECIDNAVCNSTSLCACDTSKHFAEGSAGDMICSCDSTTAQTSDGTCLKRVGQLCSSAADCLPTDGMVCADRGGAKKCTCDTTKHYAEGTDDDTVCSCQASHVKRGDKICGLVIGQSCNVSGTPCMDNAVCDAQTSTCNCDPAKFFLPGSAGATFCSCDTSKSVLKADGSCGLKVGATCERSSAATACGLYASCNTTTFLCSCSGGLSKQNADGTCSKNHASRAGASFSLLTLAVLVASRLLA